MEKKKLVGRVVRDGNNKKVLSVDVNVKVNYSEDTATTHGIFVGTKAMQQIMLMNLANQIRGKQLKFDTEEKIRAWAVEFSKLYALEQFGFSGVSVIKREDGSIEGIAPGFELEIVE